MSKKVDHRVAKNKEAFLKAYRASLGNITIACENVNVGRQTYYNWIESDKDFEAECGHVEEELIDFAQSKLLENMNGIKVLGAKGIVYDRAPDTIALLFFLKTKGKKRGYVERTEHTGEGGDPIQIIYNKPKKK